MPNFNKTGSLILALFCPVERNLTKQIRTCRSSFWTQVNSTDVMGWDVFVSLSMKQHAKELQTFVGYF